MVLFLSLPGTSHLEAQSLTVMKAPPKGPLIPGQAFSLSFGFNISTSPEDVIPSRLVGPDIEGLILASSTCSVEIEDNADPVQTTITVTLDLIAAQVGDARLGPLELTLTHTDKSAKILSSHPLTFTIIPWKEKYRFHILTGTTLIGLIGLGIWGAWEFRRKRRIMERHQAGIAFKKGKIRAEAKALEEMGQLGHHLLNGEYADFCLTLIGILRDYFSSVHPGSVFPTSAEDLSPHAMAHLPENAARKWQAFMNLFEEIRFANVTPHRDDVERIKTLARDILAEHREHQDPNEGDMHGYEKHQ